METPRGRGPADRLLGLALTIFETTLLLYLAVHLLESIWSELLLALLVSVGIGAALWLIQRRRNNRYW